MTLTIQLDNTLVAQLKKKASSNQLPVEEFAAQLLGNAIAQLEEIELWDTQNRRRLALIRKSVRTGLCEAEQTELDELQSALDRQLDLVDDQLFDSLSNMKQQWVLARRVIHTAHTAVG